MSGLLKKEIRLLLPSWGAALLLVSVLRLVRSFPRTDDAVEFLLFCVSPVLMVILALNSFGRELSAGTFSNLLAQPVTRSRIWWTKALVLACALGSISAIWFSALIADPVAHQNPADVHKAFGQFALLPLIVYSGALWTVLLLRQVAAAFWLTVLIPVMLAMVTMYLTQELGMPIQTVIEQSKVGNAFVTHQTTRIQTEESIAVVLVLYSIVGFWAAMRMFIRAQDVQWTGGEIALPGWFKWPRWSASPRMMQGRRPRLALLLKEFQLHQSQLVIAGVLAVVHLAVIVLRPAQGSLNASPVQELLTYHLWVLWPVMALLIGCAAVAEERKLGTLEAQLCLPVRRRTQFVLKAGAALGLALFFGVVMPVLFEGGRILPDFSANQALILAASAMAGENLAESVFFVISALFPVLPFLPFLIVTVVLLAFSFYASTLARNTLQAIAPAILGIVLIFALVFGAEVISGSYNPPWRGPLIYLIGVPVLALMLAGLAYWNFKRVLVGWPVWRRNLLTFLAALTGIMVVTTAIYHRAWELCLRLEPAHGSERLSRTEPSEIHVEGNRIAARLPDGRLWQSLWLYDVMPHAGGRPSLVNPQALGGSNWAHAAYSIRPTEAVAIQTDGSLWLVETPSHAIAWTNNRLVTGHLEPARLTHIGNDTNWHKVIREAWSPSFLLLKTDGSLWSWGTNRFDSRQKWPGLAAFEIRRLGEASDWADMTCMANSIYLWTTNGQAWTADPNSRRTKKEAAVELAPGFIMERYRELDHTRWRSLANSSGPYQIQMGVRDDGTLWAWGARLHDFVDLNAIKGRIGSETNWVAVTCAHDAAGDLKMVALKTDGSLWRWDFSWRARPAPATAKPVRFSSHNDWLAIAGDWNGLVGLAADGSLWHWQSQPSPSRLAGFNFLPPLLAASRRPQLLGNIFNSVQ